MLTALPESFGQCLPELKECLLAEHWEKLALDKDKVPLSPQFEIYLDREARGELCFIPLRDAGKIVGYWISFVAPGLHYSTCFTAIMDIWNVKAEYENTVAPVILMRAVEREYKRRGVQRSFVGEKLHKPCGRLYKAFGYAPVEMTYSKWMGA